MGELGSPIRPTVGGGTGSKGATLVSLSGLILIAGIQGPLHRPKMASELTTVIVEPINGLSHRGMMPGSGLVFVLRRGGCGLCFRDGVHISRALGFACPLRTAGDQCLCVHGDAAKGAFEQFPGSEANPRAWIASLDRVAVDRIEANRHAV